MEVDNDLGGDHGDNEMGELDDDPYFFLSNVEPEVFRAVVAQDCSTGERLIYQDLSKHHFTADEKIWFCRFHVRNKVVAVSHACALYCICIDTAKGWLYKYDRNEIFHTVKGKPLRIDENVLNNLKDQHTTLL